MSTKESDLILDKKDGIKLKIDENNDNDLSGLIIGIGENDKVDKDYYSAFKMCAINCAGSAYIYNTIINNESVSVKSGDIVKINWNYKDNKIFFYVNNEKFATGSFTLNNNGSS